MKVDSLDSYLGLPIQVGRKKSDAFKAIMNRTASIINSWLKRLLSSAGKEVFVKLDIQAIPTYAFSIFLALNGVIEDIQSMVSCIWWGNGDKKRGWSMLAWEGLCHPKDMGETLYYKVLSAKYFPEGDIFHPKIVDKPSFTWTSISTAARTLQEGFGWSVANGKSIDIWMDQWGFEGLSGSSICMDRRLGKEKYVSDLLTNNGGGWKDERILELYGESLKDQICKIPVSHNDHADQRIWYHNPGVGFGPYRTFWKLIWKLKTLPKIWIFCWKLGHDILPTYDKIAGIRSGFSSSCPRCGTVRETLIHAMRDCPKAKAVLELLNENFTYCIDWLEEAMRILDGLAMADFITVLWNIWNSRNNRIFRGVDKDARVTWERASCLSNDFRIFNLIGTSMLPIVNEDRGWKKPKLGTIKVNFDATFQSNKASFGVLARDHDGFVIGGLMGMLENAKSAEWAELRAMEESISFARSKGWEKVTVESDCASLVNRSSNKAVDMLCNLAIENHCTITFNEDYQLEIHDCILKDAII
ncbi:reverse transcriptase [Gossypium australe]|uniref:Reverse transcriptase n=1 Tax=Gossypium australe TaxID=47621 RepID=A0A5B6VGH7_9ROSI|nr:reverse transcriptase [Gossypium australe]